MRKAFTLIELLVVISIIALLIAILLPALSQAKEQSVWTQCLVNERSVHTASSAYATDAKGLYIPAKSQSGAVRVQVGLNAPEVELFREYGYADDNTWDCPGREFQPDYNVSTGALNHGYQYLAGFETWRIAGTNYEAKAPVKMEDSTSEIAFIADATIQAVTGSWQATTGYYYSDMQPHGSSSPDNRPDASNHVFGDGSGGRVQGSELIPMHSWSGSRQPYWFQKDLGDYDPAP